MGPEEILPNYGQLETAPEERMVSRVLGFAVGTSEGWMHWGGHTVVLPNFQPSDGFAQRFSEAAAAYAASSADILKGLVVDYYIGRLALVTHSKRDADDPGMSILWEGAI